VAVVVLILALTYGALQIQVTLAGFLNGESVWSKAQKQSVIDLAAYAANGDPTLLAAYRQNHAVLDHDRFARDQIAGGTFDHGAVAKAFSDAGVIPEAIPGMIFILRYFDSAPYIKEAMTAWRSTDSTVDELDGMADELERQWRDGRVTGDKALLYRQRIEQLNDFIEPRSNLFSVEIANGASWLGKVLFAAVVGVAALASLFWLGMARRIMAGIRGTEERFGLLFGSAADGIVMVDEARGTILEVNETAAGWTGQTRQALLGQRFDALFIPGPDQAPAAEGKLTGTLLGARGELRPVELHGNLVTWGGRPVRQAIIRDISERIAMEQERRIAAEALASITEGVVIADAQRRVTAVNAAQTGLTGFDSGALLGQRFDELRRQPDGRELPPSMWTRIDADGHWTGEVLSRRQDGSTYPEWLSISTIRDAEGQIQRYVAVFTDITTNKADQRRLEHMATHDPLTGLANRAEFELRCGHAISAATRERGAAVVMFIDLDAFKVVNDSYSHAVGDRLLQKVADRIRKELSPGDMAGRIGGDEFTVLMSGLKTREEAGDLGRRLLTALAERFMVGDYEIFLSASIGIAGFPLDGSEPTALIANADAAMYAAKTEERNALRFYTPRMHADARRRLELAAELRQALHRDEFYLVYQPSVELRSGRVVAVEALLRWQHPERGLVMPDEFIPIAETLGLIRQIDEWVINAACAQIRRWDMARMPQIRVAVNVSATWFGHPDFVQSVRDALSASQLSAQRLLLEITEGALLRLGEDTERTMHALHDMGVGVAIDDFGTGYSSLTYLKLPAVAYLKIDRSFVRGLPDSSNDVAIVDAMIAMSGSLGLITIAEGIENDAQHAFLTKAGCAEGQGYLYSRPVAAANIERLLSPVNTAPQPRLTLVPPLRS
jgi:diguanylate cyclase (GGDEF)-like protein/PAS domain S-box-containing protein